MTPFSELPTDHFARRAPLVMVRACFIYHGEKIKRFVGSTWKIALSSYNELGPAWTEHADWFALDPSPSIS